LCSCILSHLILQYGANKTTGFSKNKIIIVDHDDREC
jgi:hypothetical protein